MTAIMDEKIFFFYQGFLFHTQTIDETVWGREGTIFISPYTFQPLTNTRHSLPTLHVR